VRTWTTLNEPWCSAYLGYASGGTLPASPTRPRRSRRAPPAARARARRRALRSAGAQSVSITLNPASSRRWTGQRRPTGTPPGSSTAAQPDLPRPAAARPVPGRHARAHGPLRDLSFIRDGDEAIINAPIDVLGVNFYQPTYVSREARQPGVPEHPGTEGIGFRAPVGPVTDMDWQIEPAR
jgi:beta-glucosidase